MSFSILEAVKLIRSTFGDKGDLYINVAEKQIDLEVSYVDIENGVFKRVTKTVSIVEIEQCHVDIIKYTVNKLVSKLKSEVNHDQ